MLRARADLGAAVEHHQAGRFAEAEAMYREILAADASNPDALHLLGMLSSEMGRHETALGYIARAITLNPAPWYYHSNLGNVFQALGRYPEAILCYQEALRLDQENAQPYYNLGNALARSGAHEDAITAYREALRRDPANAQAHGNLGSALANLGRFQEAVACLQRALRLKPDDAEFVNNLGTAREGIGRRSEALLCYRRAVELQADYAEAYANLGRLLLEERRPEEARACLEQAIQLKPQMPQPHNNLGAVLEAQGRCEEAVACYRQALRLDPGHAPAHNNLGNVLRSQGRPREAAACYEKALESQPDYAEAHWNRALALLVTGDFEAGWQEYGWRLRLKGLAPRQFPQPLWDGAALGGRTILLHAEQGLGDTLQFIRYAPLVKQSGGRVLLECQAPLAPLLETVRGVDQVIPAGSPLPDFDVQAPLLELPQIFGTALATIPAEVPYLAGDPKRVARWRRKIVRPGKRAIGLVWAGNPAHTNDRNRSLPLSCFAPLARLPGVRLFSLQKGPQAAELLAPPAGLRLRDLGQELADFAETAAAILNLDLVITADTAVAHLAGALARPVWTLLPFAPDWRWLLDRADSPWYPTMRLFRQPRPRDWAAAIEKVREALADAHHC